MVKRIICWIYTKKVRKLFEFEQNGERDTMSEAVEEYAKECAREATANVVKNVMENMKLTMEQTLDILKIQGEEREAIIQLLQKQQ